MGAAQMKPMIVGTEAAAARLHGPCQCNTTTAQPNGRVSSTAAHAADGRGREPTWMSLSARKEGASQLKKRGRAAAHGPS